MKRLLFLLLFAALGGCVFVGRYGTYQRTEVIDQVGTNRVTKVDLDVKP